MILRPYLRVERWAEKKSPPMQTYRVGSSGDSRYSCISDPPILASGGKSTVSKASSKQLGKVFTYVSSQTRIWRGFSVVCYQSQIGERKIYAQTHEGISIFIAALLWQAVVATLALA